MSKVKTGHELRKLGKSKFTPLLFFLFAFLLYGNTIGHDYALDDALAINQNSFTQQGVSGIKGIFENDMLYGFFNQRRDLVAGGRYRPLSMATFAMEVELFGLNPHVSHFINVLLYGFLGWMVFIFAKSITQSIIPQINHRYFIAFCTTLIFMAHPLHTEVVANIKGRDELFSLTFSLLTAWLLIKSYRSKKYWFYFLSLFTYTLALFSKENSITFLAIFPLLFLLLKNVPLKEYVKTIGYLLPVAIFFYVRSQVLDGASFLEVSKELMNNPFLKWEGNQLIEYTFSERYGTVLHTFARYLKLLVIPHPLTSDYYPTQIPATNLTHWTSIIGMIFCFGSAALAILFRNSNKLIAFGIAFFWITFSIASNVLIIIGTNMSERFMFAPSFGFALIIAVLLGKFVWNKKESERKKPLSYALIGSLAFVLVLTVLTIIRNPAWKNNLSLFTTDVVTSPNSAKILNAAGGELTQQSLLPKNANEKEAMLRQALRHLNDAVAVHPGYANAYLGRANAHFYLKEYSKAINNYKSVINMNSNHVDATQNIIIALREYGREYGEEKGDINKSISLLKEARSYDPKDFETNRLLGVAYGVGGLHEQAIPYFEAALEAQPEHARTHFDLSIALNALGNTAAAQAARARAYALDPTLPQ